MPHSYIKIWVHSVLCTKFKRPYITKDIEKKVYTHIAEKLKGLGCSVNLINGTEDHIHILFRLGRNYSIGHIMKTIKGSSSHWINTEKVTSKKFEWKPGYSAFGVDYENLDRVFYYIRNQKLHHKRQDFDQEIKELYEESGN